MTRGVRTFGVVALCLTAGVVLPVASHAAMPPGQAMAGQDTPVAPEAELERRTRSLAAELRCPVCQGLSIEDSPTDLAREMRAVVREQLEAGRSEAEVKGYFVDKYGEWILLRPEPSGFNLLVYVLPWLAVLMGGGAIALLVRRWVRVSGGEGDPLDLDERLGDDAEEAAATAEPNW